MEGELGNLIVSLVVGALGGNAAGLALKKYSLGTLGNTIAGVLGGGLGSEILGSLLGGTAPTGLGASIAGAGTGGAVLMLIVGMIKQMMAPKS